VVGTIQEILLPGELISDDGVINLEAEETVAKNGFDFNHKIVHLEHKTDMRVPEEQYRKS